jgi:hypothetical protein
MFDGDAGDDDGEVHLGFGRIVASHYRSSASYHIC